MKIRLFALILLISILFCGCSSEGVLTAEDPATEETLVQTEEEATAEEKTKEEEKTETETADVPTALRLNEEEQAARNALLTQVLKGKKISFVGDSVSTFQGYSNNVKYNATIGDNAVYYKGTNHGFSKVKETWWMQTVDATGMELLVNNSWSGDQVTKRGIERAKQLHNNDGVKPDVIVVYFGTNDFRRGVPLDEFKTAYDTMISGMKAAYPEAEVYLCNFVFTLNVADGVRPENMENYNAVISDLARQYQATFIDLHNGTGITRRNVAAHMADGSLHPNYKGMDRISECVLSAFAENYIQK